MNKKIIIGMFVFLFLASSAYALEEGSTYGLFNVVVVEQSPEVIPAIALEHNSHARVKLFLSVTNLNFGTIDYRIKDVQVRLAESSPYITSIRNDRLAPEEEDLDYDSYFALKNDTLVVSDVNLKRIQSGKRVVIEDDTAEKICRGEIPQEENFQELIPDSITAPLRVDIIFSACKGKFETVDGRLTCPQGFLGPEDFRYDEEYYTRAERERQECLDNVQDRAIRDNWDVEKVTKEKERCGRASTENPRYISDTVYMNVDIGVDKREISNKIAPAEIENQICKTIDYRENLDNWINETAKAEKFFGGVCLASIFGSAANLLFTGNACNSMDAISLGCDWLFCPSDECIGGIEPTGSIVASTTMCWDFDKGFFGKSLGFTLSDEYVENTQIIGHPDISPNKDNKEFITYNQDLIESSGDYKNSFCEYKPGDSPDLQPVPHYACVPGVKGNLEIIDLLMEQYQQCLIKAQQGAVSVSECDNLRDYYLCDRVLNEALPLMYGGGAQGLIGNVFNKVVETPFDLALGDKSEEFYESRTSATKHVIEQSVARYDNVPFIQLIGGQKQFLREQLCSAFIEGDLFDLEDFKEKFNLLDTNYPDSAVVNTERRIWDYYRLDEDVDITSSSTENKYQRFYAEFRDEDGQIYTATELAIEFNDNELGNLELTGEYFEREGHNPKGKNSYIIDFNDGTTQTLDSGTYNIGIDYKVLDRNKKVKSWFSGTVENPGISSGTGLGNVVLVKLDNLYNYDYAGKSHEVYVSYAHLDSVDVQIGEKLNIGEVVGIMGETGATLSGPHVDFSAWFFTDDLKKIYLDPRDIRYKSGNVNDNVYKDVVIANDGTPLLPAEYSYDVIYMVYNAESSGLGTQNGAFNIFLTDLTNTRGQSCGNRINIASGNVQEGELIQDNAFVVNNCRADTQCLSFKGNTFCRPINKTLSLDTRQSDPIGLSLISKDDSDNDGISDNWEAKYFGINGVEEKGSCASCRGGDPDGDGYCNAEEYLTGTDPQLKASRPVNEPNCQAAIIELDNRANNQQSSYQNQQQASSINQNTQNNQNIQENDITDEERLSGILNNKCNCGSNCDEYAEWIIENSESGSVIVDPLLSASVMIHESNCVQEKENGESRGLMQVTPIAFEDSCQTSNLNYNDIVGNGNDEENIQCGIKVLKKAYTRFAKDASAVSVYKGGVEGICFNQEYRNKYLSYIGWDIALRGYNGLGCATGNPNYVEDINEIYDDLKREFFS